ncbi:MAG: hypothetical protein DDT19_01025 [Syntrophomonadaceae bacterium]|nr:hypothetical protein [Bacillota bacterium]
MRIMEAYVGEYASGKSEVSINRALSLLGGELPVTLVDLDLVEPFYTLRPLKRELKTMGLDVIAWDTKDVLGFGETGSLLQPQMRWALQRESHVIFDVGYGVSGSRVFNLLEGFATSELKVLAVLNVSRPMTANLEDIVEYLQGFEQLDGLVNNTHLGDETDLATIYHGVELGAAVAEVMGIPVIATAVEERFRAQLGRVDQRGNPLRYLKLFMGRAFW